MAPGQEASLATGVPMFGPKVFRKQMYGIEESTCDIVGTFGASRSHWRPHSDSAPKELCPSCPPRYAPDCMCCLYFASFSYFSVIVVVLPQCLAVGPTKTF